MIHPNITRAARVLAATCALAAVGLPGAGQTMAADPVQLPSRPHLMLPISRTASVGTASAQAPLTYQIAGAPVTHHPVVYLDFFGQQWALGWTDPGTVYGSSKAETYLIDYVRYMASSGGPSAVSQYCSGVAVGTINCGSSGAHVTLPATYGGYWIDTTSTYQPAGLVPDCFFACVGNSTASTDQIGTEALRAQLHFQGKNGYNPDAIYVILLPNAAATPGFGYYCAYHQSTTDALNRPVAYVDMPYLADLQNPTIGASLCGMNFVNGTNNSFGNGYYDGYSMVTGHEIAEAMTDPLPTANNAWRDSGGAEIGDKCQWITPGQPGGAHNIGPDSLGHVYAVQTEYSNLDGGCI